MRSARNARYFPGSVYLTSRDIFVRKVVRCARYFPRSVCKVSPRVCASNRAGEPELGAPEPSIFDGAGAVTLICICCGPEP